MMNKKEIFKKVGGIITELNEQYEYLSQSPDNLNELELELFSANANFLSDHISILVKLNEKAEKAIPATIENPEANNANEETSQSESPASFVEEVVEEIIEAEAHTEAEPVADEPLDQEEEFVSSDWKFELEKEPAITFDFEEKQPESLFDRPLTEEEKQVIEEKLKLNSRVEAEHPVEDEAPIAHLAEESTTIVDEPAFVETEAEITMKEVVISERTVAVPNEQIASDIPTPTVNELLAQSLNKPTVASQFNSRPVKDLKSLISLNDKLLFVRDLFNGYSLAYSEALELLNRFDSFESADNFLKQNYSVKNNWADKQDAADKFYEVLNRRFSK